MHRVAEDVFRYRWGPRDLLNVYLLGDVLVDAGTPRSAKRLLRSLTGHSVGAHALTHAHGDHVGSSKRIAETLDVPVWAGARDADAVQSGHQVVPRNRAKPLLDRLATFPGVRVARRLEEGDDLGHGFTVLEAPGHSPGHVAFWREADRTLVCGDVWFHMLLPSLRPGLREPPKPFTPDPARNRDSARRLAALRPALVLFGHGPPLRDPDALAAFTDALPR